MFANVPSLQGRLPTATLLRASSGSDRTQKLTFGTDLYTIRALWLIRNTMNIISVRPLTDSVAVNIPRAFHRVPCRIMFKYNETSNVPSCR
jgi:hypothetical protein